MKIYAVLFFCLDLLNSFCNFLIHILAELGFLKRLQPEETSLQISEQ